MSTIPNSPAAQGGRGNAVPRVIVATTALLTFISFWKAAAIVLNDLASSAYYAGAKPKASLARPPLVHPRHHVVFVRRSCGVRRSCSMFVRGGVYRAVKQSLGGSLAKFSVSALMFDYILTGPISGVSRANISAPSRRTRPVFPLHKIPFLRRTTGLIAASFAIIVTAYFGGKTPRAFPSPAKKPSTS